MSDGTADLWLVTWAMYSEAAHAVVVAAEDEAGARAAALDAVEAWNGRPVERDWATDITVSPVRDGLVHVTEAPH